MDTEVVKVLKSWKSSLDHYEKLDVWKLSANLSVLGAYLRASDLRDKHSGFSKKDFILREKCSCGTSMLRQSLLMTLVSFVELSRRGCAKLIIA